MPVYEPPQSFILVTFGAASCSNTLTTYPYAEMANTSAALNTESSSHVKIRIPTGKQAFLSKLAVTCGTGPATQGSTFTVRKRSAGGGTGAGSDTALTCALATSATAASDDTHTVTVIDGDEITVSCVPTGGQTAGPQGGVNVTVLLTIY